ncbi:MAG: hypothetical protein WCK98_05300 [bacterium]
MDSKNLITEIAATTLGLSTIAGFSVLGLPIWACGGAGIGIYAGIKLLASSSQKGLTSLDMNKLPADISKLVLETQTTLEKIETINSVIQNPSSKDKINQIIALGYKLLDVLSDEYNASTLLKDVKKLFTNFQTTIQKYSDLQKHTSVTSSDKQDTLFTDFDKLLDKIKTTLENYYRKGIRSDLQDFEVDMKVISSKIDEAG